MGERSAYLGWNRLWLCVVCVLLLWMTTLETSIRITKMALVPPELDLVMATCEGQLGRVDEQKRDYVQCVDNQMAVCGQNLEVGVQEELRRAGNASKVNEDTLRQVLETSNGARQYLEQMKISIGNYLELHADQNVVLGYNNVSRCSLSEREVAQGLINDVSDITVPISESAQYFTSQSNQRVDHLATHVTAVNQYNNDYVTNKTGSLHETSVDLVSNVLPPKLYAVNESVQDFKESVDSLILCLSLEEVSSKRCEYSDDHNSAYDLYVQVENSVNAQVMAMSAVFEDITEDVEDWKGDVSDAIEKAAEFYGAVEGVMNVLQSSYGISQLCGLSSPDWCDFSVNDFFFDINSMTIPQPKLNFMGDSSELWSHLDVAVQETNNQIDALTSEVSSQLEGTASEMVTAISEVDFIPSDYNPPEYGYAEDANDESLNQQQDGITFNANITSILGSMSTNMTGVTINATGNDIQTDAADIPLSSIIKSKVSSAWASFSNDELDLTNVIHAATTIEAILVIFDLTYRVFHTFRIVRRHWNGSMVELPVVNMKREDSTWTECLCKWLAYVDSVGTFGVLIMVFLVIIVYIIASVYTTSLLSYRAACVTETSNSTYVMRGMYTMAFNYASLEGNFALSKGVSSQNERAMSQCMMHSESSKSEYQHFVQQVQLLNGTYTESASDLDIISRCVAEEAISSFYMSNCCHYADYRDTYEGCATIYSNSSACAIDPFTGNVLMPPWHYADQVSPMSGAYDDVVSVGTDAIFSCDPLPVCSISCNGPDDSIISSSAQMCSCSAEWYIHGSVIQVLLMCIIYLAMNASRSLITQGLAMLLWRQLHPPILECRLECSVDGTVLEADDSHIVECERGHDPDGKDDQEEYDSRQSTDSMLKENIENELRHFRRVGYMYVLAGILMNVAWMATLPFVEDSITYRPNEATI